MRVKQYTLTGIGAADTAVYAALQASVANTPLTLTGAAASFSARELTLTSGSDLSAVNYTIVGRDRWGNLVTSTVAGPNAVTLLLKTTWTSIVSITPLQASANTISVGFPQRVTTPWVGLDTMNATDVLPTAIISMETTAGSPTASAELTVERFTQYDADGARAIASAATLNNTTVAAVQGTAVRAVLTSAAGSARFTFARPRY